MSRLSGVLVMALLVAVLVCAALVSTTRHATSVGDAAVAPTIASAPSSSSSSSSSSPSVSSPSVPVMLGVEGDQSVAAQLKAARVRADDYYRNINPQLPAIQFKQQLHNLIFNKTRITYNQVWDAFPLLDSAPRLPSPCQQGLIDPYSANCWNINSKCGNYKKEGDCWNREHTWPKSWWNGEDAPHGAYTDLHHLRPTDGYVNGLRSNWVLGEVSPVKQRYVSTSGAIIGGSRTPGFDGTVFEVPDAEKGEFARTYFYMAVAYDGVFQCCDTDGVNAAHIKPWLETLLRRWHDTFPPSDGERLRTDRIFTLFQKNRNPFIDHPDWVNLIQNF